MLTYGVEIEAVLPAGVTYAQAAAAVATGGVECYFAGYDHTTQARRWKIVTDQSLSVGNVVGGTAIELVSPILKESQFEQIVKVCAELARLGATVNRSCGLHVHIGARELTLGTLKKLAELYHENEEIIDSLLPPSRRGNSNNYLRSLKGLTDLQRLARAREVTTVAEAVSGSNRYVKLNYMAYFRHGTVEFRHHSGTIDPEKILRWIGFCTKLLETAQREQDIPIGGATRPAAYVSAPAAYWRSGRRTRVLYEMLTRPEGVTSEELQNRLGVRARPNIRWHLIRANAPTGSCGRRYGHEVFRLDPPNEVEAAPVVAPIQFPPTLDGLCERLQMTAEERVFWSDRITALSPESGPGAVVSNTMRRQQGVGGTITGRTAR